MISQDVLMSHRLFTLNHEQQWCQVVALSLRGKKGLTGLINVVEWTGPGKRMEKNIDILEMVQGITI
jgi:hypothetical protein